jgi:ABC-type cobalamin transport system permease subunit
MWRIEMGPAKTRDGGNKIVTAAKALIVIVQTFAGVLIAKYGADSAIGLLIQAILNLAPMLPDAEAQVVEYDGENAGVLSDPADAPGLSADRPAYTPPSE